MVLILTGLNAGGCSIARQGGAFAQMEGDDAPTGALAHPTSLEPTESDLAFVRNAGSDVLTRGTKDASQPWENPKTGARGSVTPLAAAYTSDDGKTCRNFLASYVNGRAESWLEGAACQSGRGRWEIHSLKSWKQG